MHFSPYKFVKQKRTSRAFVCWHWPDRVPTVLGDLVVELFVSSGEPSPDANMAEAASALVTFATANGELLLDLIYGHYKYAEQDNWLEYWGVPTELTRDRVLSQVTSIVLTVRRHGNGTLATVFVDPLWDPEHKLDLEFRDGHIVAANGEPFVLDGEVLRRA